MEDGTIILLIVLGSVALFVTIWCLVLWLLSTLSGWKALAAKYRTSETNIFPTLKFQSGGVRQIYFNNSLVVGMPEEGFYLSTFPLLRRFFPPLLIPWAEITASRKRQLFGFSLRLRFAGSPEITVSLRKRTCLKMLQLIDALPDDKIHPGIRQLKDALTSVI